MILVLLYRKREKPSEGSVNRFTYLFHNSVELFWLVSINVVRGIVYHLCREQIVKIRMIKIDVGPLLHNTSFLQNKSKLNYMNLKLEALFPAYNWIMTSSWLCVYSPTLWYGLDSWSGPLSRPMNCPPRSARHTACWLAWTEAAGEPAAAWASWPNPETLSWRGSPPRHWEKNQDAFLFLPVFSLQHENDSYFLHALSWVDK